MALDSLEKRASVPGVGSPWYRTKLPGTVDEAWRLASGNVYAGNALSASADVTLVASLTETQVVAGGQTIVFTLSNDTWEATLGADNAVSTAFINSLDSGGAEAFGWDAVVKAGLTFADVTRDSDTQVTVLLPAFPTYSITADETITADLDASVFTTSVIDVTATPTFTVTDVSPVSAGTSGGGGGRTFAFPIDEKKSPQVFAIEQEIKIVKKQKAKAVTQQINVDTGALSKAAHTRSAAILAMLNEQLERLEKQRALQLALERQARSMEQADAEEVRVEKAKRRALRRKRLRMISILIQ